uniref:Uncharacterized protein n=1 Tax=Glossina austeni TaxID=7395 RepID=A0A1A9UF67_GLOAU
MKCCLCDSLSNHFISLPFIRVSNHCHWFAVRNEQKTATSADKSIYNAGKIPTVVRGASEKNSNFISASWSALLLLLLLHWLWRGIKLMRRSLLLLQLLIACIVYRSEKCSKQLPEHNKLLRFELIPYNRHAYNLLGSDQTSGPDVYKLVIGWIQKCLN